MINFNNITHKSEHLVFICPNEQKYIIETTILIQKFQEFKCHLCCYSEFLIPISNVYYTSENDIKISTSFNASKTIGEPLSLSIIEGNSADATSFCFGFIKDQYGLKPAAIICAITDKSLLSQNILLTNQYINGVISSQFDVKTFIYSSKDFFSLNESIKKQNPYIIIIYNKDYFIFRKHN